MGSKILAVFAIVFVGIAFGIAAVVVFLTRGKSEFWVDKKLRIGGMLITLSSIIAGSSGCGVFQPTCYDTARPPDPPEVLCYDVVVEVFSFELNNVSNSEQLVITGKKTGSDGSFVYKILQGKDTLSSGKLEIDSTGAFVIKLGKKAQVGNYVLAIDEAQGFGQYIDFQVEDDDK